MAREARSEKTPSPSFRLLDRFRLALLAAVLGGVLLLVPAWCARSRAEVVFDGVIVKKESPGLESRYGTRVQYVLVIRDGSGKLIRFAVPRGLYENARVGMPVRKTEGESWPTIGNRQEGATR